MSEADTRCARVGCGHDAYLHHGSAEGPHECEALLDDGSHCECRDYVEW